MSKNALLLILSAVLSAAAAQCTEGWHLCF
jgi:hypothetical protein